MKFKIVQVGNYFVIDGFRNEYFICNFGVFDKLSEAENKLILLKSKERKKHITL